MSTLNTARNTLHNSNIDQTLDSSPLQRLEDLHIKHDGPLLINSKIEQWNYSRLERNEFKGPIKDLDTRRGNSKYALERLFQPSPNPQLRQDLNLEFVDNLSDSSEDEFVLYDATPMLKSIPSMTSLDSLDDFIFSTTERTCKRKMLSPIPDADENDEENVGERMDVNCGATIPSYVDFKLPEQYTHEDSFAETR